MATLGSDDELYSSTQVAEIPGCELQSSNPDDYSFSFQLQSSQSPPQIEDKTDNDKFAHTRAKRKRTSRADFAILEAEYQQNPRPDKSTRADIVERVSLSDKEVQIWFQNRRQMTRRKCRTWQPNEITSIIRSSQESRDDPVSENLTSSSQPHGAAEPYNLTTCAQGLSSPTSSQGVAPPQQGTADHHEATLVNFVRSIEPHDCEGHDEHGDASWKPIVASVEADDTAKMSDAVFMRNTLLGSSKAVPKSGLLEDGPNLALPNETKDADKRQGATQPRRNSSAVRLSMSLDGKAQVVVGSTPSPPKKLHSRASGLQRSQSLISTNSQGPSSNIDVPVLNRSRVQGISRNARTWEFYCDRDARDSLTRAAELDSRGSASGVISLIRSGSSGRNPLVPIGKENFQFMKTEGLKRKRMTGYSEQKPKLTRTSSSVARLQTTLQEDRSNLKADVQIWADPEGDSDKENWEPGIERPHRIIQSLTQTTKSTMSKGVLQENLNTLSHSSSLGAIMEKDPALSARKGKQQLMSHKENQKPLHDEVSAFMEEGTTSRENDEMDAVQNLLSLRQGAWLQ